MKKREQLNNEQQDYLSKVYTNIELNTFIIFNKLGFKPYIFSVFVISRILKNIKMDINVKNIQYLWNKIEKKNISKSAISKALTILCKYKYLRKNKLNKIVLNMQFKTNKLYKSLLTKNYYNSKIIIDRYFIKYFVKNSKEINLHSCFISMIIDKLWKNEVVTYHEIHKKLGISRYYLNKSKLNTESIKISFNNQELSAFKHTKFNIVTIGNIYNIEYNPVIFKTNKHIKQNNEKRQMKIKKAGSTGWVHVSKRFLSMTCPAFFSEFRKKFTKHLSESYLLCRMNSNNLVLQY